jgi:hypothetical protein
VVLRLATVLVVVIVFAVARIGDAHAPARLLSTGLKLAYIAIFT